MTICPAGHESRSDDYCDLCGLPMDAGDAGDAEQGPSQPEAVGDEAASGTDGVCPHCSAQNPADALFCEACGYDFTTGAVPRSAGPDDTPPTITVVSPAEGRPAAAGDAAGVTDAAGGANVSPEVTEGWVAEVWVDPDWYDDQQSPDPLPSPGVPTVVHLRHQSLLIGRSSRSRGIAPDIDLSSDNGVSRRHAQLTTDGTRWFVEDLGSANGTYVGDAVGPLPANPIATGQKLEVGPGERIYLGAWTRIVIRRAAPGEG